MKLQIQWTVDPPQGWQWINSEDWVTLPAKPEPTGGEIIDDTPGWIYGLNVQGVLFFGDHYAVVHNSDYIVVACWNDDPEDYAPEDFFGSVWTFYPTVIQNGQHNTRQFSSRYGNIHPVGIPIHTTGGDVQFYEWSAFVKPVSSLIRHGIWVPDTAPYDIFPHAFWESWIE